MKRIFTLLVLVTSGLVNAQAYKGKGDVKQHVGANFQNHGTGIYVSTDFGVGENISFGFSGNYLLKADNYADGTFNTDGTLSIAEPKFLDRFDVKARFNANLGNVFKMNKNMDVYPGLDLGLRNFGAHLGFRYFFTDGFGLFTEAALPIAKYDSELVGFDFYNNQFMFNVGVSFNL